MHSRFRMKGVTVTALAALLALLVVPATLFALPKPGAPGRGFRLMARAIGAMTINRVYCGLSATGEVCVDSSGSSTIGGGFWPKGTPQQYVFNSGLQAAGAVGASGGGGPAFAWTGDTTGAFFFDPKGTTQHGEQVEPIWNSGDPADKAAWPAAAYVPQGDEEATIYDVNLQGQLQASQADIWTIAWDGNPGQNAGRPHPLGIAVEARGMGWNFPTFNNDIIYFTYTFYNVTSDCDADYANIRPSIRSEIRALGTRFQQLNNAAFGVTIPACGYTIKDFYANFSADMDVSSSAGSNYSSVNLPFSLGYVYQVNFQSPDNGASLPVDISGDPFLNAYGFVGVKYLQSPRDPVTHAELGIKLFSNTVNGGLFNDPPNVQALYRYVTGTVSPAKGDGNCNFSPTTDRICYVKNDGSADMRFFQSSGPQDLPPGGFGTIVVAYEFASAVKSGACPTPDCGIVPPGDPRFLSDAAQLASGGANPVDTMTGFAGYVDDNSDGVVQQNEIRTIPGSLLGKAKVAQTVFDNKFLLPQAPNTPDFFLVPGDNQVTVVWRKTTSEATGDLFYSVASKPKVTVDPDGPGPLPPVTINNLLFDPNYRKFDVEGYRVYRGRVDNPTSLTMLAQFDYSGTTMNDYLGTVNPVADCAPELRDAAGDPIIGAGCGNISDTAVAGTFPADSNVYEIKSPFIQVKLGFRKALANGEALVISADTAVTGLESGKSAFELKDTGVPFTYVDGTAKNNLRYFYSVTAFDVNSIQSGPSSLESPRSTKAAVPVHAAPNYLTSGGVTSISHIGRGLNTDSMHPSTPTIDAATGVFSGPARPATGAALGFVGAFLSQVVSQPGNMAVRLDSLTPGSVYDGIPGTLYLTAGTAKIQAAYLPSTDASSSNISASFEGGTISGGLASRYGGDGNYHLQGAFQMKVTGSYLNTIFGRGCVNGGGHTNPQCGYDGARWFDGATETFAHPTQGNNVNFSNADISNPTNAGSVAGIAHIFEGRAYQTEPNLYRQVEGVFGTITTAADYKVYWSSTPGHPDSVIDITNNVPVPFATDFTKGYTWGFLTTAAASAGGAGSGDGRPGVLTNTDIGCVLPMQTFAQANAVLACAAATPFQFVNTITTGPIAYGKSTAQDGSAAPAANPGFGFYLAGHFFLFEMAPAAALPASPTVWTLRTYTGAVDGGGGANSAACADAVCTAGHFGSYKFTAAPSPLTAPLAGMQATYTSSNSVRQATDADLALVHTVPDPYYITNGFERSTTGKVIKFVNLPDRAIVRIYSTSGVLVRVLEHTSTTHDGSLDWDVRNRNNQVVASGVYFYAIEAQNARRVGRMTIVNYAQ